MMFFAKFSQTPCWKDLAAHEPKRLDRNDVIVLCDAEKKHSPNDYVLCFTRLGYVYCVRRSLSKTVRTGPEELGSLEIWGRKYDE